MKYLKRLYDWLLCWAEKLFGPKTLSEVSFGVASFFSIYTDVLLILIDEKIFQT